MLRRRAAAQGVSLRNPICNRWRFSSMLLADLAKTAYGPFFFAWKMRKVSAFAGKFEREM
ncbi:TPA: hypothetical protein MED77_002640 [Klebsiella pneumoniae]|nr:hypothetical protein [Klebsiella pneumoniae]